jgi:hypothetical protein
MIPAILYLLYGGLMYILVRVISINHLVLVKEYTEQFFIVDGCKNFKIKTNKRIFRKSVKILSKIFSKQKFYYIEKTKENKIKFNTIKGPILTSVPP